jgi:hypothetical protein
MMAAPIVISSKQPPGKYPGMPSGIPFRGWPSYPRPISPAPREGWGNPLLVHIY